MMLIIYYQKIVDLYEVYHTKCVFKFLAFAPPIDINGISNLPTATKQGAQNRRVEAGGQIFGLRAPTLGGREEPKMADDADTSRFCQPQRAESPCKR